MSAFYSLLISALMLKVAILGCDPTKCTPDITASMLAQTDSIIQYAEDGMNAPAPVETPVVDNPQAPAQTQQQVQVQAPQVQAPVAQEQVTLAFVADPTFEVIEYRQGGQVLMQVHVVFDTTLPTDAVLTTGHGTQGTDQTGTHHDFTSGVIAQNTYTYVLAAGSLRYTKTLTGCAGIDIPLTGQISCSE